MLHLYTRNRWYTHAAAVLEEMGRQGVEPDVAAYGTLISACGEPDDAAFVPLAKAMESSQFEPCRTAYRLVFVPPANDAVSQTGNRVGAKQVGLNLASSHDERMGLMISPPLIHIWIFTGRYLYGVRLMLLPPSRRACSTSSPGHAAAFITAGELPMLTSTGPADSFCFTVSATQGIWVGESWKPS